MGLPRDQQKFTILRSSPVEEAESDVKINAQKHHKQYHSTHAPHFPDR
jgi:hypothetical protein